MKGTSQSVTYPSICLALLIVLLSLTTHAQTAKPVKINPSGAAPPAPTDQVNLFLHLDKSVYQSQETIWFTGYVLNRDEDLMLHQNTLYVVLIDPVKKRPVLSQRFQIRNGLSQGFLSLPDSIAAGDYWFVGYTNALLETGDQPLFRKLITVRSETAPFKVMYAGLKESGDTILVRYKISAPHHDRVTTGKFAYTLFDSTQAITSNQAEIDSAGEVSIPVSTEQEWGKHREIAATVTLKETSKEFILPVFPNRSRSPNEKDRSPVAKVTITPDAIQYHQRSKVTLHIHIADSSGHPLPGLFSMAVAASAKMQSDSAAGILSYETTPPAVPLPANLKNITSDMPDSGYVLKDETVVKKPVTLALMGNNFGLIETDSTGKFALPWSALTAPVGGINYISVAGQSPERYTIVVTSLADRFGQQLATVHFPVPSDYNIPTPETDTTGETIPGMLQAAIVKAKVSNEYNAETGEYTSTHCDQDFVCLESTLNGAPDGHPIRLLNCPEMHSHSSSLVIKPEEGQRYGYMPRKRPCGFSCPVATVTYHCAVPVLPSFIKPLKPILGTKPFPVPYNAEKEMLGSGLQSTIFWQPRLVTDANGDATITFFTNDLTGKFTCLLQGVSKAGIIQGKAAYSVAE